MKETGAVRLGVLVGSLRREALSRKIAKALIERASKDVDCSIIEIGDLPLYNQDLDDSPPDQWTRFRAELAACDALLFVTPEYNRSIPGCLKNATDVGSRPENQNFFDGLPAGIVSVTPYSLGAFGANHALRQSFVYLNLRVMQQPEAYIGNAADMLNDRGKVTSKKSDLFLRSFMTALGQWIDLIGGPAPATFDAFMKAREIASNAYINGDAAPLIDMSTANDPATFFPPSGERVVGAKEVAKSHKHGAKAFVQGSSGRFEVLASGVSGRVGYWSGIQHADAQLKGKDASVPMKLRTTEIFRFEQGVWKLAHRHADFIEQKG
ncbi:MAG: NAD(P)H-dependent oxidoreductase [Burkholderiaceae bacterium]|nr:NAD(P)H-dependent oxidoreductase [Burkholderiaceae bacterium]